jgi:hypothetical protein
VLGIVLLVVVQLAARLLGIAMRRLGKFSARPVAWLGECSLMDCCSREQRRRRRAPAPAMWVPGQPPRATVRMVTNPLAELGREATGGGTAATPEPIAWPPFAILGPGPHGGASPPLGEPATNLPSARGPASCPICFEPYSDPADASCMAVPRVLGCGHTACEICLGKMLAPLLVERSGKGKRMECPRCRKPCVVPKGKAANLPLNYDILGV